MTDIQTLLKPTTKQKVFLCSSIAIIAIGYVLSPIFMRMIIDGIVITKDLHALYFTISILFFTEIITTLTNFFFEKLVKNSAFNKTSMARELFINKTLSTRNNIDTEAFNLIYNRQIQSIVNHFYVYKWYLYKNFVVVWMLILIAMIIDYYAMFALVLLFVINISIQFFYKFKLKKSNEYYSLIKDNKTDLIEIIQAKDALIDFNINHTVKNELFDNLKLLNTLEVKNNNILLTSNHIAQAIRPFSIVSTLLVGSIGFMNGYSSFGSIWALLLVVFRVLGPLKNIINWYMTKENLNYQFNSVKNILENDLPYHFKKPAFHNKLIRFIEKNIKNDTSLIIKHQFNDIDLLRSLRHWKSNAPYRVGIFSSDNFKMLNSLEAQNYDYILCVLKHEHIKIIDKDIDNLLKLKGFFFFNQKELIHFNTQYPIIDFNN